VKRTYPAGNRTSPLGATIRAIAALFALGVLLMRKSQHSLELLETPSLPASPDKGTTKAETLKNKSPWN
jgi:hypothetical protein